MWRAAGDEEDAVMLGSGIGATDDVVEILFCADRTVVDLEDDEVRRYTGTLQFARFEGLDLQAVIDTQTFFLCVGQVGERGTQDRGFSSAEMTPVPPSRLVSVAWTVSVLPSRRSVTETTSPGR